MAGIPFWMVLMFVGCWCGWGRCRCKGGCQCEESGCGCGAGCMCGWRCRKRSSRLFANLVIVWLILSIMGGGMGTPLVVLLACVAIGYFIRKMEELQREDAMKGVTTEEMEEAAGE